jgi:hypothetical protein
MKTFPMRTLSQPLLLFLCLHPFALTSSAQPQPGDVFREYAWAKPEGDAGGSLRVGGKLDYGGGLIELPHALDLEHATRAEVVVEKLLCHDGTHGLAISLNGKAWVSFPEAPGIPAPQWDYQHFTFPVASVPLAQFKAGTGNTFALRVSDEHSWNWPQNLIYGLQLRIYYDDAKKRHPTGRVTSPRTGTAIGRAAELAAEATSADSRVRQVDFVGLYDGVNREGDGNYRQWHYTYFKGALTNHIGTATAAPWRVAWDTSWIPDQREPMQFAARITDETGLTFLTAAVGGVKLERPGLSVELCRPFDVPKKWVTRSGEKSEKFRVTGDLTRATAAQFVWSSWSPGYMDGLFLNNQKVFDVEGPRDACYWHRVLLTDMSALHPGENILKTGLTPKHDGKMVHGMEVNWPGVMILIQYRTER